MERETAEERPTPAIDAVRCTGCGLCVLACPTGALEMAGQTAIVRNPRACQYTGGCEMVCPERAISRPFRVAPLEAARPCGQNKGASEMATTSPPEHDASAVQARDWLRIGLAAAAAGIAAVLLAQRLAIAAWPEIALFKPLDSYARSALFVLVPAAGATAAFAWLVRRYADPAPRFIALSLAVLLVSIVPDYLLPTPHRTLLASSVAAVLHAVAALTIVSLLLAGYRRQAAR